MGRVTVAHGNITTNGPYGGGGGDPWDDYQTIGGITGVVGYTIGSGEYIDSFQAVYTTQNGVVIGPKHGGGGGGLTTVSFASGERIVSAGVRSGRYADSLLFFTVDVGGRVHQYGPYGGTGGSYHGVTGDIVAFFGRAGGLIDAIGFYGSNFQAAAGEVTADALLELTKKAVPSAKRA